MSWSTSGDDTQARSRCVARRGALVLSVLGIWAGSCLACAGSSPPSQSTSNSAASPQSVDDARLARAGEGADEWLAHGRTWSEQRFSPLADIDTENVNQLGLVWTFDLETTRGVEATPLMADGSLYVTGPWSVVYAFDAKTGALRWKFDPEVPGGHARVLCCGVVNRGVALYRGRIYLGTLDGRLIALDAKTGSLVWEVQTTDPTLPYSITGAPRVLQGLVVIGNGGAEFGVRGYVSAYRAEDGELAWRTWTVPGNPDLPFESKALEMAAYTWTGDWWKTGGGGTVWDGMAYDPELDLLYVGVGNGSPHARDHRSPGGGDNLFLSSILALRPATGEVVWHFQTTPADNWDYTSTQHIMLADLEIDGRVRKVLMQAPKNGFFFVLDRETGEFISAKPFVKVTWAKGVDVHGRPIENPDNDYSKGPQMVWPGPFGGHNWHPMAFHPGTGLVYIPSQDMASRYEVDPAWEHRKRSLNTGLSTDFFTGSVDPDAGISVVGSLLAWDPVAQREAWRVEHGGAWNGGTLATAGDLIFQGTADGRFAAYRAQDGEKLWESPVGTGVMAAPITYRIDGVQYVVVAAGWGSGYSLSAGPAAALPAVRGGGRVLTFALGGEVEIPPPSPEPPRGPVPPLPEGVSEADLREGDRLFARECLLCHGTFAVGGGSVPDLRFSSPEVHERFVDITLGGIRADRGMPSFADVLTPSQVRQIQAWLISRGHQSLD
ncbi:PQQ-dependent dehydrogenase, methanol/ethanol family [Myxococcota bacterium]|nr:PQQ-dependent dehydrogenase, methanol/ethanol family [Myxococcota bacterium]